jgi:hypothetical protein
VTVEWIKLHDDELRDLHFLPDVTGVMKSRRVRWAVRVARVGGKNA